MKVLHVEAGMHLYGGALQVVFLLRGLKGLGVHSVLACPTGSAIAQEATPHAEVRPMPMKGDADIGLLGRLRALIREVKPDVLHLHSRRGSDIWGALAGRLEGVPVVLSRRVDNPEKPWIVRQKYKLYDEVITISEGIRQVLLAEGVPPHKLHCVLSAVDTAQYRPDRTHLVPRRVQAASRCPEHRHGGAIHPAQGPPDLARRPAHRAATAAAGSGAFVRPGAHP
jgi:hypothetical protein